MDIIPLLKKEMQQEAITTRKMLERIPEDKLGWKPHEKSMSMQNLAVHIAELPSWVSMGLTTSELDFAKMDYNPTTVNSVEDIVQLFNKSLASGLSALDNAKEEDLLPTWTMRSGEKIHGVMTKYEVIRHAFAQTTHHRAQLGVYLRLLNVAIPGSYGPSADEPNF
ncbi:MAG: DinB family protein [Bacteroidota bacterium]|nr:DinB family protein [Bacteroidota bacterium]